MRKPLHRYKRCRGFFAPKITHMDYLKQSERCRYRAAQCLENKNFSLFFRWARLCDHFQRKFLRHCKSMV